MANTTTPKRLGFGSPIEREYKIIDSVPLKKDPSVHMAKYIKLVKV